MLDKGNYRPTRTIQCLSKMFESVFVEQLYTCTLNVTSSLLFIILSNKGMNDMTKKKTKMPFHFLKTVLHTHILNNIFPLIKIIQA